MKIFLIDREYITLHKKVSFPLRISLLSIGSLLLKSNYDETFENLRLLLTFILNFLI